MRKMIILLLLLLVLFNCAFADEIVFQSIPWMSDDMNVLKGLKEAGLIRGDISFITLSNEKAVFINHNEDIKYQPNVLSKYKNCCFSTSLQDNVKGMIAGSPLRNLVLTFAYDGEYKLIGVQIDLIGMDYITLKEKITRVYGEGEIRTIFEEGIESIIWEGDNNTGILLYTESEDSDYQLYYGRLDAAEILANCIVAPDPDDVSGL